MNLAGVAPGTRVELEDLSIAEVLEPSADGEHIRVRYVDSPYEPALVGTEAVISDDMVTGVVTEGAGATTLLKGEGRTYERID